MRKPAAPVEAAAIASLPNDSAIELPFETRELRKGLKSFLKRPVSVSGEIVKFAETSDTHTRSVGSFQWGVYAFFDYDGEPIYVGQTNEQLSARIGRHLTNQRTDAVAMSVLGNR